MGKGRRRGSLCRGCNKLLSYGQKDYCPRCKKDNARALDKMLKQTYLVPPWCSP